MPVSISCVLTQQVEDGQIMLLTISRERVIFFQKSEVIGVRMLVAMVEHRLTQFRGVYKRTSAEIKDVKGGRRDKLVGEECYLVASLSE